MGGHRVEDLVGCPRERFLASEWHERDLAAVFRPAWHLVGHRSQLPEAGSFLTFALGDDELVVVRDAEGRVHAYDNVCRHRGHRLCLTREGRLRAGTRITCPYHGWSYAVEDGSCVTAVRMPEDFDRSPWGLRAGLVEEYLGLIFVCFDGDAQPVGELATACGTGGYDLTRMKVATVRRIELEANWKVVVENNAECYHCTLNHPELSRRYDVWGTPIAQDEWGSAYLKDPTLPTTFDWTGSALGDAYRRNGPEPACRLPLPRTDVGAGETFRLGWNPNGLVMFLPDYAWTWSVKPTAAERTEVTQTWLVHEAAQEGADYTPEGVMDFFGTVIDEDVSLCEEVQRGLRMRGYSPGPLNPAYQGGGLGFHHWYMRRTEGA